MIKSLFAGALLTLAVAGSAYAATDTEMDVRIDQLMGEGTHQQYHDFFDKLQKAVADKDSKTIASLVDYPITVYVNKRKTNIKNAQDFIRVYDKVFDKKFSDIILEKKYSDLFVRDTGVMVGDAGELWYSGICTKKDCSKFVIRIIAINNND
ncbi:hypothetical protein SC171_18875 [Pantoea cypripedii]|uniref:hypothetical protein n=1 Tax=Pantoea cypripedii TaxID=55209 RepID=UPI002FCA031F